MQLCQWQISFWPLSFSLYRWQFATVTDAFLFSCTLQFCDSWRRGSKMLRCSSVWKTAWLFCCSFSFALTLALVVCLCQCNILIISLSVSPLPLHFSPFLCIFCFLTLSLTSICISIGYPPKAGTWTKPAFFVCSGWCLCSKVQRPAWGEVLSLTQTEPWTHMWTRSIRMHILSSAGSCCWNRCQMHSMPSTSSHVFMLLLPLVSYSRTYLKHSLNVWFFYSYLLHSVPISLPFSSFKLWLSVISPVGMHCLPVLLLSFCYPWPCF